MCFSGMEPTGHGRFPAGHVSITETCDVVRVLSGSRNGKTIGCSETPLAGLLLSSAVGVMVLTSQNGRGRSACIMQQFNC